MTKNGKFGVVDMGTNSVRLLLCHLEEGRFQSVDKQVKMTRLGKGVNETGKLDEERVIETVEVVKTFLRDAQKYGVLDFYVMATSAVRDASNANELKQLLKRETGLEIDVISGQDEAIVGFQGVLAGRPNSNQRVLVIDIGGGSTELIVGDASGILFSTSIDAGAVRMTGAFLSQDPVDALEKTEMLQAIQLLFDPALNQVKALNPSVAIGIGGTAATFAAMDLEMVTYSREKIHGRSVLTDKVQGLIETLERNSIEERKKIPGLEPKRADIIYAGGCILKYILDALAFEAYEFSDFDNLEGYLYTQLKTHKK